MHIYTYEYYIPYLLIEPSKSNTPHLKVEASLFSKLSMGEMWYWYHGNKWQCPPVVI